MPRYLAKSGLFKNRALGYFLRSAGQIPVERLSKNAIGAFDAAVQAVRSGECVVVYPEGTLTMDAQGSCSRAALGITGVTDKAYRPERLEQMLSGKKLDSTLIHQAAMEATRNIEVIEDINGSVEYRKHLTEVYVDRAIHQALAG